MNVTRTLRAACAGLAALALAACSDATQPALISDAELTADLVTSAGDAIADQVGELVNTEIFAGLGGAAPQTSPPGFPPGVTVNRSRTCYDAADQPQAQCDDQTTSYIVFMLTMDGSFSRSVTGPRGSFTLDRTIHRDHNLTISGLLGTETSRTHEGHGASSDTTEFTATGNEGGSMSRTLKESALDSVQAIVFNLPRATNPWPVSGSIVRRMTGEATITNGTRTETRSFDRRVVVTFPADAQGNVQIQINAQVCTLNLVTHTVSNCQ